MSPASPQARYDCLLESGRIDDDPHQRVAVAALDEVWTALQNNPRKSWLPWRNDNGDAVKGLYLWGGVGRGKTWLMDLFHECLPKDFGRRIHFHRFMQHVHDGLKSLSRERDPLPRIADRWADQCRVLCLDEFFVSDIADAMLLAGLLEALFEREVTLVTTSNIEPRLLYADGLQRAKFLPAIDLLERHCRVVEVAGDTDFRLRLLKRSEIYHHPLDEAADRSLQSSYERMACGSDLPPSLMINGREFTARRRGDGIAWFDFAELCQKPRGAADYIELARVFNTVLLSEIPRLNDQEADAVRRLITLVDEFYDRNVKLLVTAESAAEDLYSGDRLAFEFERTCSRLTEMQSPDYLSTPHLP